MRSNVTLQYGLRWDAQLMPETVDPQTTAFAPFLTNPKFPSDGTIPDQRAMWQPRAGATWDVRGNGRSVLRASAGIYFARQNMLSQVGSVTTNGLQQQTLFVSTDNVRHVRRGAADLAGRAHADAGGGRAVSAVHRRARLPSRLRESAHVRRSTSATSRRSSPTSPGMPTTRTRAGAT